MESKECKNWSKQACQASGLTISAPVLAQGVANTHAAQAKGSDGACSVQITKSLLFTTARLRRWRRHARAMSARVVSLAAAALHFAPRGLRSTPVRNDTASASPGLGTVLHEEYVEQCIYISCTWFLT
eukprot:6179022-Pleurochrysis_carterae.AAC.2